MRLLLEMRAALDGRGASPPAEAGAARVIL